MQASLQTHSAISQRWNALKIEYPAPPLVPPFLWGNISVNLSRISVNCSTVDYFWNSSYRGERPLRFENSEFVNLDSAGPVVFRRQR